LQRWDDLVHHMKAIRNVFLAKQFLQGGYASSSRACGCTSFNLVF